MLSGSDTGSGCSWLQCLSPWARPALRQVKSDYNPGGMHVFCSVASSSLVQAAGLHAAPLAHDASDRVALRSGARSAASNYGQGQGRG